jgi:predicted nucleic acid-binding Zn ribbon protein
MTNEHATPLGTLIQQLMRESGLDKRVQEANVLEQWERVVGEMATRATVSKKLVQGRLIVQMISPVWRQELMLRHDEVREKLNALVGEEIVREIVFR